MSCDVGGVGAQENTEEGGADGVLGENELQQLATQVILISSSHAIRDGWVSGDQAKPYLFEHVKRRIESTSVLLYLF